MEDPDSRVAPGSLDLDRRDALDEPARARGAVGSDALDERARARGAVGSDALDEPGPARGAVGSDALDEPAPARGAVARDALDEPGPARGAVAREWLRAAGSPLMVVLLVLVIVVGGVFVRLGFWQLDRAGIRGQEAAQIERAERLAADPVPIEGVLAPHTALTPDELGRRVSMRGTYAAGEEVLVPGRQVGGVDAVLVVTAFHLTEGPHAGAIMPVVRGWAPSAELAATRLEAGGDRDDGAFGDVVVPAAPTGVVDVVGLLAGGEAVEPGALPPGQVGSISPAQLTNLWGGPMFSAYLVAVTADQAAGEGPVELDAAPVPVAETGLNLQSLAYAIEWWIFAAFAVFMWLRILRDRVRERRERAREGPEQAGTPVRA